jgi:hypothetical protein
MHNSIDIKESEREKELRNKFLINKMAILGIAVLTVVAIALFASPGLVLRQAQSRDASPDTPVQSEPANEPIFTNVTVIPEKLVVNLSQTFTVEVWINNVTGMAGWEIRLVWNRNIIRCVKAQVNTPQEWGGVPFDWFNKTETDVDPNAVYTAWQFGPGIENEYSDTCGQYFKCEICGPSGSDYHNTFTGSIPVVKLTFLALQTGSTSLSLWKYGFDEAGIKIGDRDANKIASISYNGLVEVQAP